jgi:hypothetical protein
MAVQLAYVAPLVVGTLRYITDRHRESFRAVVAGALCATEDMTDEAREASWRRPVFGDLFEAVMPAAMRARSAERRQQLANVLAAGLRSDEAQATRLLAVAQLLEEVDEYGVLWLQYFRARLSFDEGREWLRQRQMLAKRQRGMDAATAAQYHLQRASLERLIALRLLKPATPIPTGTTTILPHDLRNRLEAVIRYLGSNENGEGHWRISGAGDMLLYIIENGDANLPSSLGSEDEDF